MVMEIGEHADMRIVAPSNTMHPVLPLAMDVLWADSSGKFSDGAPGGGPHRYVFNMILRGWDNILKVGVSEAPHGGFVFSAIAMCFVIISTSATAVS